MNTIYTRSTRLQAFCWFFILLFTNQLFFPAVAVALTAGPSQPEVKSFEPVGTTEMVNLFSGDFTYNIPLLEVPGPDGGYPINLFYNSVTSMEQEATWTGLGWNINVGALSRSMRGLPDDFNGEKVGRKLDMRKNTTTTVGGLVSVEVAGVDFSSRLSLGVNYIHNSYKGVGFSIDPAISLGASPIEGAYSANLSAGISLSTLDVASANIGFSLGRELGKRTRVGVSSNLSFDPTGNESFSLGWSVSGKDKNNTNGYTKVLGSTTSFSKQAYTPSIAIPWGGFNLSFVGSFSPGGFLVHGKIGLQGSYSEQHIVNGGAWTEESGYGYNYLQAAHKTSITDFNREKDGTLEPHKRYLANPVMTHDVYNITGQGVGGVFRSYRSDYGFLFNPALESSTGGGDLGIDGGAIVKIGVDAMLNFRKEVQSNWPYISWVKYEGKELGSNYEPFYYKMAGEMTAEKANSYDYIGADEARDKPVRLKRQHFDYYKWNGGELEAEKEVDATSWNNQGSYETKVQWKNTRHHRDIGDRKPRSSSVQPITNKLLMNGGAEILPEFDIKHYTTNSLNNYDLSPTSNYVDVARPDNEQNAAFTVVGQDGVRWNYGLPVYNHKQREASFSVEPLTTCGKQTTMFSENGSRSDIDYTPSNANLRSNDRIDEQELPQFVHSHLLTSVLGTDYGDIDGIAGPSDGDVGYWMKTNYVKLSADYQWRAPFFGANYARGFENDQADDMGAVTWGERDVYLPATIETKTHIAFFEVSKRFDARGAKHYIQTATDNNSNKFGEYSYKLDKVILYAKSDIKANGKANATPLKTVHFKYDYSLCSSIDNNNPTDATADADNQNLWNNGVKTGKLTLKAVYFTYENNARGALSPYQFEYNSLNPDYNNGKIDRWGIYRSENLQTAYDECDNMNLPYTSQDPADKQQLDADVAAWHLKQIKTPSGALINLELERDDYGYVQDARATRMFKLESLSEGSGGDNTLEVVPNPSTGNRTLQFELEHPTNDTRELKAYVEDLPEVERNGTRYKQLLYKIRANLRNGNNGNDLWEYVTGYCEIEKDGVDDQIEFEPSSSVNGKFTKANIVVKDSRIYVKGKNYHPMLQNSWRFLKEYLPNKMLEVDLGGPPDAIIQLSQIGENINAIFAGFYQYCANNEFGKQVDLERSYIRLNSPDRIQYGGGIRVKSITMDDNWTPTANQTSTMGVVYDYTTRDGNGELYSSGVVENEPSIGYEECALRWAVPQVEKNLSGIVDVDWYEYPLNEGYYPGAEVGYSKVTVRSLASDYALKRFKNDPLDPEPSDLNNTSYATTGQTVYEYYTAKDFPIITNKTALDKALTEPWASALTGLFLFSRVDKYTGTQGYSIEMNNMHGRERKIHTYSQRPDGSFEDIPLTAMEYTYKSKERVDYRRGKPNRSIRVLDNEVRVLIDDTPTTENALTETQLMGVDYEFFIDGREVLQIGHSGGVQINSHAILIPFPPFTIPAFIPIPSYSYNENKSRTSVSNKVIVRSGILEEVYAFDGQAHLVTTNKVFDPKTGQPLLSTVDNQLTGEIYNYSVPAYLAHEGMGAAAENWGHRLDFTFSTPDNLTGYFPTNLSNEELENVVPGDEFIAELKDGSSNVVAKARAVYMGELYVQGGSKQPQFDIINHSTLGLPQGTLTAVCTNTRSGKRNLIGASIAQYSTIDTDGTTGGANPLTNRTTIPATTAAAVEISVSGGVASLSPTTATSVAQVTLDNVLSTSGAEFSEDWALEYYNYNVNTNNINPYLSGKKGVWKSKSTYAYIDARTQEPLTAQPKLADIRSSGVLNGVTLYNWQDPFVQYVEGSKWVRTQDISKYRLGGQAVESRDVLGNYQAALYGYGDNLVTAQAANAKYYEVGYEGFEEWNQGDQTLGYLETKGYINNGNIDVLPGKSNTYREQHEHYRLIYPMYKPSNGKSYVLIKKPYVAHALNIEKASVYLSNGSTKERIEATIENIYPLDAGTGAYKAGGLTNLIDADTEGEYTVLELNFSNAYNKEMFTGGGNWWAGELTLFYQRPVSEQAAIKNTVQVVQDYAHTGEYSLLFPADEPNLGYVLEQKLLNLQDGKKYVFSAWVKMQQTPYPAAHPATMTYANSGTSIEVNGVAMGPTGPVIEGWQKVEGTFTYDNGWVSPNTDNAFEIKVKPSINYLYLDDIRIFPADGNIVSYVYDPVDFKLRATLDDNNYATFYVYDEAGNLISTKRETERGIKSIQEARNYIQPTN